MQNFDFSNPTRIVFGEGVIAKLGKLLPETAQVLIVVGGSSAEKNEHTSCSSHALPTCGPLAA